MAEPVVTETIGNNAIILTISDEDKVMPIEDPGFTILTEDDDLLSESGCSSTDLSPKQDYNYKFGLEVGWETLSNNMEHKAELLLSDKEDETTNTKNPDAVTKAVVVSLNRCPSLTNTQANHYLILPHKQNNLESELSDLNFYWITLIVFLLFFWLNLNCLPYLWIHWPIHH